MNPTEVMRLAAESERYLGKYPRQDSSPAARLHPSTHPTTILTGCSSRRENAKSRKNEGREKGQPLHPSAHYGPYWVHPSTTPPQVTPRGLCTEYTQYTKPLVACYTKLHTIRSRKLHPSQRTRPGTLHRHSQLTRQRKRANARCPRGSPPRGRESQEHEITRERTHERQLPLSPFILPTSSFRSPSFRAANCLVVRETPACEEPLTASRTPHQQPGPGGPGNCDPPGYPGHPWSGSGGGIARSVRSATRTRPERETTPDCSAGRVTGAHAEASR